VEFSLPNGSPYKFVDSKITGRAPLWIKSGTDQFASAATVDAGGKKLVAEIKEDRSGDLMEH
jgi:hypothetical protein